MQILNNGRKVISLLAIILCILSLSPPAAAAEQEQLLESYRGLVIAVAPSEENPFGELIGYESIAYDVEVRILNGPFRDQLITVYHVTGDNPSYDIHVVPGNKILVEAEVVDGQLVGAYIADHVRDTAVYVLVGLFVAIVLVVGGKSGFRAIFSLAVTLLLVIQFFLPLLLRGYNPLLLAVVLSVLATVITMVVVSGMSRKTLAAIIGISAGVVVSGVLALIFGNLSKLTGLSHEEAQMLLYIPQGIDFNFRGLLFSGIMIGALGAIMDVGMSVSSAMFEIKKVSPGITLGELLRSGMNVGRDVMGTMTNTLILAYLGSSAPLMLLFYAYQIPLERILNMDAIVTELVRAFSGSIGLIAAIPLTAIAAAWLAAGAKQTESEAA